MPTKDEKERLSRIAAMPCVACGDYPVEIHHCVNQQHRKRDHKRTIGLCTPCHRGPFSIHSARKSFREKYGHEENLLEKTNELLKS